MASSMTTSPMTSGQIDRACDILRAKLTKHASEFSSDAVQTAFGQSELGAEWLAVFRNRVEAVSNMIVRHVKVDRSRTPQEMLDATGRKQYTDSKVVEGVPRGEGEEIDVVFFNVGRRLSEDELEQELSYRGLKSADFYSQAQVHIDDPSFADEHPNGIHWKDAAGKWCFASFGLWLDERNVRVNRRDGGWGGGWWFAGVCK